jgi:hypothetical protein
MPGWAEAYVCHLFGKPVFVVPVDCGGHTILGWVWFVAFCFPEWGCVVVILTMWELIRKGLKNQVVRPMVEEAGCQACEQLSLGERVC